jgi:hypothetical protein
MSQVFAADAVSNPAIQNPTGGVEAVLLTGNSLSPPFGNAKAIVIATFTINPAASTTVVTGKLRRNPASENVVIADTVNMTISGGSQGTLCVMGSDAIPDGRAVRYQLSCLQVGGSGTGSVYAVTITTLLISG